MPLYNLFDRAFQVLYAVIGTLDRVFINVEKYEVVTQFSLLDILEVVFGVSVIKGIVSFAFGKVVEPKI